MKINTKTDSELVVSYNFGWIYTVFGVMGLVITAGLVGLIYVLDHTAGQTKVANADAWVLGSAVISLLILLIHPSQRLVANRQSGQVTVQRRILWIGPQQGKHSLPINEITKVEVVANLNFPRPGELIATPQLRLPKAPLTIFGKSGDALKFGNLSAIPVEGLKPDPTRMPELDAAKQIADWLGVPLERKQATNTLLAQKVTDLPG